jgi:peptide/nickel transport system substrate-binding protein
MRRRNQAAIAVIIIVVMIAAAGTALYSSILQQQRKSPTSLTISFANVPVLDPAVGSDEASSTAFVNLYDTLVYPTADGDVRPSIAASWSASDDGLSWTFKIRSDVRFHDGTRLTANDVVFSMSRLIAIGQGFSFLFASYVSRISAPDDQTVSIVLKKRFGPFVSSLVKLYILNEKVMKAHMKTPGLFGDNGDYGTEWLVSNDAGSGPYKIKEISPQTYLLMEKFKDYWGEFNKNAPDEVKFLATTDPDMIMRLMKKGQLDITDRWQSEKSLEALSELDGVHLTNLPTMSELYLMMNTKKPPTDDVYIRAAITYAFDYEAAVNRVFPGNPQATGTVPASIPGHDPDSPVYQRNMPSARQNLDLSKYDQELGKYPLIYRWLSEVPADDELAFLFADDMRDLGLQVEIAKAPWTEIVDEMSNPDTAPNIVPMLVDAWYPEAGSILSQRYHSTSAGTWMQNEWLQDPAIDAMINDAISTLDKQDRFAKYIQIQRRLVDIYPSVFVIDQYERRAYYAAYLDWYAASGRPMPIVGYNLDCRYIGVDAEKKKNMFGLVNGPSGLSLLDDTGTALMWKKVHAFSGNLSVRDTPGSRVDADPTDNAVFSWQERERTWIPCPNPAQPMRDG